MLNNKNFYPTPEHIIKKMLEPYTKVVNGWNDYGINIMPKINRIIDPSAGKCDILDYIKDNYSKRDYKLYAIEIDPVLQEVIKGKGYNLIHDDFLTYKPENTFDLIVMNPPFDKGCEHLLQAWEILDEGEIVCLLNAETIRNDYTEKRRLLKHIVDNFGSYEDLGKCFTGAERKTDVETVLIRLTKKATENPFDFDFTEVNEEKDFNFEETLKTGYTIALNDVTGGMLRQYEKTKEAYIDYVKAKEKLKFYSNGLVNANDCIIKMADDSLSRNNDKKNAFSDFVDTLKSSAWKKILRRLNFEKYMTKRIKDNFSKFEGAQGSMALTRENIINLIQTLAFNSKQILKQGIPDVCELLMRYDKTNTSHFEGWKTNKAYKINHKNILPVLSFDYSSRFSVNYNRRDEVLDIDKVLCYLSGKNYDNMLIWDKSYKNEEDKKEYEEGKMLSLNYAISQIKIGDSSQYESEFFKFRCYKKGTVHIVWKDKKLLELFNREAFQGLKNLGDGK